jgi:hypothetical protein
LDGIFDLCGVPEDKFRAISSAVDKLDKVSLLFTLLFIFEKILGCAFLFCNTLFIPIFFLDVMDRCPKRNDGRKALGPSHC